ncbi:MULTISPECIES: hypothetical protein [unclassified Clostridium]|nr:MULTISPECIES: hypothetical protein [unclassified Clostridium]
MADEKCTVLGIRIDTEERKRFDEFVGKKGQNTHLRRLDDFFY